MELRHYFGILGRSWPLVIGLPLLVALITVSLAFILPPRYGMTVEMFVTQQQIATRPDNVTLPDYNNYNSWAASEFVVDDVLQLVETRRFANDIVAWAKQQHTVDLDPVAVNDGLSAERTHRMITLEVEADTRDHARLIAEGAVAMLGQNGLAYWGRNNTASLTVSPLDVPQQASRVGGTIGLALDVVLRTLLALLLGIGLAFLRHYLDQTLRGRSDLEALGFDVVGAIPVARSAKS